MEDLVACVGWDWADREHQVCLREAGRTRMERQTVQGTAEAIRDWANAMMCRFHGMPVGVFIETSRGPVIHALMGYPFLVIYPINPQSAACFRQAFHPSGKKDDPVDSEELLEMGEKHRDKLRPLRPSDPATRLLGLLSEHRRKLVDQLTATTNCLRDNLKGYFPQALKLLGDLNTPMACAFLRRWPSLQALRRAPVGKLNEFYHRHGSRSETLIVERLKLLREAVPLTQDEAIMGASLATTESLVSLIAVLLDAIRKVEQRIEPIYQSHPDFAIVDSFPGLGPALGPRVIAIMGGAGEQFTSASDIQRLTGVAPVTVRSGTMIHIQRRVRRSHFLNQTVIEWAGLSIQSSLWAKALYDQRIAAGSNHWTITRLLAFKWLRILWACWQTRTPYSEATYLEALTKHGSPLRAKIAA